MDLKIKGKRVVVAGGSRGIGRAIALAFAQEGAAVSICARGAEGVKDAEAALKAASAKVHAATCDLGDGDAVRAYVEAAATALGGIDILVNNASGFGRTDDEAGWAASINVDLMGTVAPRRQRSRTFRRLAAARSCISPRSRVWRPACARRPMVP